MHPTRLVASLGAIMACGLATLAMITFPVAALALGGSVGGNGASASSARPVTSMVSAVTTTVAPNPTWAPTQP